MRGEAQFPDVEACAALPYVPMDAFRLGAQGSQTSTYAALSQERLMGLEPTTFCMASRRSSQLSYSRAERSV